MIRRKATANWIGSGMQGHGTLTSQSKVLDNTQYSFKSRFEEGIGTNPEELVAAAHAGCFSMKLAFVLASMEVTPESIDTTCTISLDNGTIVESHLEVSVSAQIDPSKFNEAIADAKANCPISKLYNTTITANAVLK